MTATEIRKQVKEAIRQFGRYSFSDKGAREVMDLEPILTDISAMPPAAASALLVDVLGSKEPLCKVLVAELVCALDGQPTEWWDALMAEPTLEALYG